MGKKEALWPPDVEDISNTQANMLLTELNSLEGDAIYLDFVVWYAVVLGGTSALLCFQYALCK